MGCCLRYRLLSSIPDIGVVVPVDHRRLPGFYRVLAELTGFYRVLLGFAGFDWVTLDFAWFNWGYFLSTRSINGQPG